MELLIFPQYNRFNGLLLHDVPEVNRRKLGLFIVTAEFTVSADKDVLQSCRFSVRLFVRNRPTDT